MTPETLVQAHLDAYNGRDLRAFLATCHPDLELFRPPAGEPVLSGREAVGRHYARERFCIEGLHAELLGRTVMGPIVVDHERVHGVGPQATEAILVFQVEPEGIRRIWVYPAGAWPGGAHGR
jgi:hypothetical protein